MSLQNSYDFTNIRIEQIFMGYLLGKGLDYLFKRFKISIKKADIQNDWTWIRLLFIHGLSFLALASISSFFRFVKLEPLSKIVWRGGWIKKSQKKIFYCGIDIYLQFFNPPRACILGTQSANLNFESPFR